MNKEKEGKINKFINNEADNYVRQLYWLHKVIADVILTHVAEATAEKMKQFALSDVMRLSVIKAIKPDAQKSGYSLEHPIITPSKARMSMLRDLLHTRSVQHAALSNVEDMLCSQPFAARLIEASKRIRPRLLTLAMSSPHAVRTALP